MVMDTIIVDTSFDESKIYITDVKPEEFEDFSPMINNRRYLVPVEQSSIDFTTIPGIVLFRKPNKDEDERHTRFICNVICRHPKMTDWKNVTFLLDSGSNQSFMTPEDFDKFAGNKLHVHMDSGSTDIFVHNPFKSMKINVVKSEQVNVNLLGTDFLNQFEFMMLSRKEGFSRIDVKFYEADLKLSTEFAEQIRKQMDAKPWFEAIPVPKAPANLPSVPKIQFPTANDPVAEFDTEIYALLQKEKGRKSNGIHLIASENFTSRAVSETLSSSLSNKYSEGYPGVRYYGGNEYIDQVELLCQKRALQVFGLDPEKWGVNVQALSASTANFAVYTAIVEPHGRIMELELADGDHLTHGFHTPTKKVSATSLFFESLPYRVNPESGLIDYDQMEKNALLFRPKIIIAGISCYAQLLDYKRFREVADKCGAYLMADMADIAGLVADGTIPSPFEYADIVTTTTHKTLRGPRGALIFYRKGVRTEIVKGEKVLYDLESKINAAVFSGLEGGPHNHTIAGIAVALKHCLTADFREYAHQVVKNAKAMAETLKLKGYNLATGDTQCHLCLLDLRPKGVDAARIETVLDMANIVTNKNTCPGDKSALKPGGIRLGAASMTSRGLKEADFVKIAEFIDKAIDIYQKNEAGFGKPKTLKEFKEAIGKNDKFVQEIGQLGEEVVAFADQFDIPGGDDI